MMQLSLSISLPRESISIPISRHIVRDTLRQIGVQEACVEDIAVAQSEACTNVVEHSGPGDEYAITVEINEQRCVISVIDTGHGFDQSAQSDPRRELRESGRGIDLMKALVDNVQFVSRPGHGTSVYLNKVLHFYDDSLVKRFASS